MREEKRFNKTNNKTFYFNKNIKSFYLRHLLYAESPGEHDILHAIKISSLKNQDFTKSALTTNNNNLYADSLNHNLNPIEFKYNIGTTNIVNTRKIYPLNIHNSNIDIDEWIQDFKQSSTLAKWSAEDTIEVLKALLPSEYITTCITSKDLDQCLDNLRKQQISKLTPFMIQEKLRKLRQSDHYLIKDYLEEVIKLVKILSLTYSYKKSEAEKRMKEIFLTGLHPECQIELVKANYFEVNDIVKYITNIEEVVLTNVQKQSLHNLKDMKITTKPLKYCSYHKSSFHSNEECRRFNEQRGSRKESKRTEKDNNLSAVIYTQEEKVFDIVSIVNKQEIKTLLDSGATQSFIDQNLVDLLKLRPVEIPESSVLFANSTKMQVNKQVTVAMSFPSAKDKEKIYNINLLLMPKLNTPIILGLDFLRQNISIINLEKNIIIFKNNGNIISLKKKEITHQSIDSELYDKYACGMSTTDEIPTNLQSLIEDTERKQSNTLFSSVEPVIIRIKEGLNLRAKPYPIKSEHFSKFRQKIKDLLHEKIIEYSDSPVTSPAFVIAKGNGDIRIIIDYRDVNEFILDDPYYFPTIYDNIGRLKGMKYFSTIDLSNSFYQIRINEKYRYITSFITPIGQFQFNSLPFGLKSSPKIFQRSLSKVLFEFENIIIFMDDILIFNKEKEDHTRDLIKIIKKLSKNNFKINFSKCEFYHETIKYLGLEIDSTGYKADLTRIKDKIFSIKINSKKAVQKFMGYINFFRPFLPKVSEILVPLTNLLKVNDFKNQIKIEEIKKIAHKLIYQNIKILYPEPNKEFLLYTDSSAFACGSILMQPHGIIGIYSHKFTETQTNYNIMEKEFLSILLSLRYFKNLIGTSTVKVFTDNRNITTNTSILSSRMQRWKILLSEFNYVINHIKGVDNNIADLVSRLDYISLEKESIEKNILKILNNQHVSNEEIIIYKLTENIRLEKHKIFTDSKGRIYLKTENARKLLQILHENYGHPGEVTIYLTIKKYYFIPRIRDTIKSIISGCIACRLSKSTSVKYGIIKGNISTTQFLETISIDFFGPITDAKKYFKTSNKKIWLFVITENFSKFTKIYKVKSLYPKEIIKKLKKFIKLIGRPKNILSDQGTTFKSREYVTWAHSNNIKLIYSTIYNPTGNGIVERRNSVIKKTLILYKGISLDQVIKIAEQRINSFICISTKQSPVQLAMNLNPFDLLKIDDYKLILKRSKENQIKTNRNSNYKINKGRKFYQYNIDDLIFVKSEKQGKLENLYDGPFRILAIGKGGNGLLIQKKKKKIWINIKKVTPFIQRKEEAACNTLHN